MEDEGVAQAALGVAGEFEAAQAEVGDALDGDGLAGGAFEGLALAAHDEGVGAGDGLEIGVEVDAENEGIIETAGALEDGAAAAATAQDGDVFAAAGFEVRFAGGGVGKAEDDEALRWLPEAQNFGAAGFAGLKEGFVRGEIGGGRVKGGIPAI